MKKTVFENIIASGEKVTEDLSDKFNHFTPQEITEPFEGAVALATLPVTVVYRKAENILIDILEDGTEVLYTGLVMDVMPERFLARDYKCDRIIGSTYKTGE